MNKLTVVAKQEVAFDIIKSDEIFSPSNLTLINYLKSIKSKRCMIFMDRNISNIYLKVIKGYFSTHNFPFHITQIVSTETEKELDNLMLVLNEIDNFGVLRRDEPVIAVGGGVLLDLVGLAASIYRRGIPYIKIPTTLVGLIDASVGAKTAINYKERRNRLGTYYPPIAAFLDKTFLKSLDSKEISSGLGEIIKLAVIKDIELFNILENHGSHILNSKLQIKGIADTVIDKSIIGMVDELKNNLWEKNLKRCVDFGHSFSPIIEMRSLNSQNPLTHGEAVTIDVLFSAIISMQRELLSKSELDRIKTIIISCGLPTYNSLFSDYTNIIESLNDTCRHRNGSQNLPLPVKIGEYRFINDLTELQIRNACDFYKDNMQ